MNDAEDCSRGSGGEGPTEGDRRAAVNGREPTVRTRRGFLGAVLAGVVGSAGCTGVLPSSGAGTSTTADTTSVASSTTTQTATDTPTGTSTPTTTRAGPLADPGDSPMRQYDAAHSGYTDHSGLNGSITKEWVFREGTPGPGYEVGSPVVADGTVYVTEGTIPEDDEARTTLYALDTATGEVQWRHRRPGSNQTGHLAVGEKRVFWVHGRSLLAFDAGTGEKAFEYFGPVRSPPVVADGTAYALGDPGGGPRTLHAVDAETTRVQFKTDLGSGGGFFTPAPAVVGDTVYVAAGDLVALRRSDGTERWRVRFQSAVSSAPTVADAAYVLTTDGRVAAIEDGEKRWTTDVPWRDGTTHLGGSPAVADGRLFVFGTWKAAAFDTAEGSTLWKRRVEESSACVVADDTLYATGLNTFSGYDPEDGGKRFTDRTDNESGSNVVAAVVDGAAYVPSDGLHALAGRREA